MKKYTYFLPALCRSIRVDASNKKQAVNTIKQQLNIDGNTVLICMEISRN
jgi:hypothetical protein